MRSGRPPQRRTNRTVNRLMREAVRHIGDHADLHPLLLAAFDRRHPRLPIDKRFEVFAHLRDLVQAHRGQLAVALMPFVRHETYGPLVAAATIDYCSLAPARDDNPVSRPEELTGLLRDSRPASPGGVMAGLLMLGDHRVCGLLAPLRPSFAPGEVEQLANCIGGFAYKCVIDFFLDWLEEVVDSREATAAELRRHLARGLVRLVSERLSPHIIDGERPFPVASARPWACDSSRTTSPTC